jgi:transposase
MSQAQLPNDSESLKRLVLQQFEACQAIRAGLIVEQLKVEKLRLEIARRKRELYCGSAKDLDLKLEQLELSVEDLEASQAELPAPLQPSPLLPSAQRARRPLPEELPRQEIILATACRCPSCGAELRRIGEDVAEILEWVQGGHTVIRRVRPKFSCQRCKTMVQAASEQRVGRHVAGPGLLAHLLVSRYVDHVPLYRQSRSLAREGIDLKRSVLADCVGGTSHLLRPLIDSIGRYVLGGKKLHTDDISVPVLCPCRDTTLQGRLWTYLRDDRAAGSARAPAVLFRYSRNRNGERPHEHLCGFRGYLQTSGSGRLDRIYRERIQEVACWAHIKRQFYDIHIAQRSSIAEGAIAHIDKLYAIETDIRGRPPNERRAMRQARAEPALASFHSWLRGMLPSLSKRSKLSIAAHEVLACWRELTRYCQDGLLEIDNSAAHRALLALVSESKNWQIAGSDDGGERAAAMYTLFGTAALNGLNVEAYLRFVLERLPDHPVERTEDFLPWRLGRQLPALRFAA